MIDNKIHQDYYLKLTVLSPVHIGADAEKRLVKNLDVFYEAPKLYKVKIKALYQALEKRKLLDLFDTIAQGNEITLPNDLLKELDANGKPIDAEPSEDIKTHIRNGMGLAYLPGSSIKGALRSILYHHIAKAKNLKKSDAILREFRDGTNDIQSDILRFFRTTDSESLKENDIEYRISKALSRAGQPNEEADKNNEWQKTILWKNGGRATFFEGLKIGATTTLRIGFMVGVPAQATSVKDLLFPENGDLLQNLFKLINEFTLEHLTREVHFLQLNPIKESNFIIAQLEKYKTEVESLIKNGNKACLMRIGAGGGFHSITGDWQYTNHTKPLEKKDRGNKGKRYKTRRFVTNNNPINAEYMGFVRLEKTNAPKTIMAIKAFDGKLEKGVSLQATYIGLDAADNKQFRVHFGEAGKEPVFAKNSKNIKDLSFAEGSLHLVKILKFDEKNNLIEDIAYHQAL